MASVVKLLYNFPITLTNSQCLRTPLHHSSSSLHLHPISLALATLLATHGYRKGSLSLSGALAAFTVGYLTLANPFPLFGTLMIVFYLAGSRVTKVKADIKASLERESEHDDDQGAVTTTVTEHKSKKGGGRDAWQVLCNGLTGCVASVVFWLIHSGEVSRQCHATSAATVGLGRMDFLSPYKWNAGKAHCILTPTLHSGWTRFLAMIALGQFACCAGDVFASELGILSKSKPVLLTSFPPRVVPPGTNGGVSILGTAASAVGGLLMGVVFVVSALFWNTACVRIARLDFVAAVYVLAVAVVAGVVGSMVSPQTKQIQYRAFEKSHSLMLDAWHHTDRLALGSTVSTNLVQCQD